MPKVPGTSIDYEVPEWLKSALYKYAFSDITPDLLFKDPLDKPIQEHTPMDVYGGLEQFIVPQTPLDWTLEALFGPLGAGLGMVTRKSDDIWKLSNRVRRGIGTREVREGERLARMADVEFGRAHEGVLKALMQDDPDLALEIAEKQLKIGRTEREAGYTVGPHLTGRPAADDLPLLQQLIKKTQAKINEITGRGAPYDEFVDVPPSKRSYTITKRPGKPTKAEAEDIELAWGYGGREYQPYEVDYPSGGMVDPNTNLRYPRAVETASGDTFKKRWIEGLPKGRSTKKVGYESKGIEHISGYTLASEGRRSEKFGDIPLRRPVTRKYLLKDSDAIQLSEAIEEKMRLIDDAGVNWMEPAQRQTGEVVPYKTLNDPEYAKYRKNIEWKDMLEKAENELRIEQFPSPISEAASEPTKYKNRLKEIDAFEKELVEEYGVDFDTELPATKKIIDAERRYNKHFSSKFNKVNSFDLSDGMYMLDKEGHAASKAGKDRLYKYAVVQPSPDYQWTYVRSLRERAMLAKSLGNEKLANKLNAKANSWRHIARFTEERVIRGEPPYSAEVIDAITEAQKGQPGYELKTISDLEDLPFGVNPFTKQSYKDIRAANKAVKQRKHKAGVYAAQDEIVPRGNVRVQRIGEVRPTKRPPREYPALEIPSPEQRIAALENRGAETLRREMAEVRRMIDSLGTVPPTVRKQVITDIVDRMRKLRAYKEINMGERLTPLPEPLPSFGKKKGN